MKVDIEYLLQTNPNMEGDIKEYYAKNNRIQIENVDGYYIRFVYCAKSDMQNFYNYLKLTKNQHKVHVEGYSSFEDYLQSVTEEQNSLNAPNPHSDLETVPSAERRQSGVQRGRAYMPTGSRDMAYNSL